MNFLIATDSSGKKYTIDPLETVTVKMRDGSLFTVAFEGYEDKTIGLAPNSLSVIGYETANYDGYIAGIANKIALPGGLFRSPQDLLLRLFPEFSESLVSPELVSHKLVQTVLDGRLGAGMIVVQDVTEFYRVSRSYTVSKDVHESRWKILKSMGYSPHEYIDVTETSDLVNRNRLNFPSSPPLPVSIVDGKQVFSVVLKATTSPNVASTLQQEMNIAQEEAELLCRSGGVIMEGERRPAAKELIAKILSAGGEARLES